MTRRGIRLHLIFGIAGVIGAFASGCGDDDGGGGPAPGGDAGETGSGGKSTGTGGKGTAGTGGAKATGGGSSVAGDAGIGGDDSPGSGGKSGGTAGEGVGGEDPGPGTGGTGGKSTGEGGAPPVPSEADIDDVIGAACEWEFRCCDDGERAYQLGPFASDADECAERLIFALRESNDANNPYKSGPGAPGQLLGTLGYVIDLDRVEIDPEGAAECMAAWADRDCNEEPDPEARCSGPSGADPCALTNLFNPKLEEGDECTEALTQTGSDNDVECVAGSTCLAAAHADNPNDFPTCVSRGLADDPCTQDDDCDFNLFCNSEGDCEEKADVGETCSFLDPDDPVPGEENIVCKAGLTCNPVTLECTAPCTLGYVCATGGLDNDGACPEDSGCTPIEVNESEATFRVCAALGEDATDLCNSDGDCVDTSHCETRVCEQDRPGSAACTAQNQCGPNLHCSGSVCTANLAAMTACTDSFQCGPSSAGCLNTGTNGFVCRNSKLANGQECGNAAACASGKCELATAAATVLTCIAGADATDSCDVDVNSGAAISCKPGLSCILGECVQQVGPGGDCSPDDGAANAALCANASTCAEIWDDQGEVCTDAPVPPANGGSGIQCDGS